jgi:hypothetical protein
MRLVLLILLLAPTVAYAGPGFGLALEAFFQAYGAYIVVAAITIYNYSEQRRMQRQQKDAFNASLQDRLATRVATEAPHVRAYGTTKVGSAIVAMFTSGDKDQYKHLICVHAAHECDAILEVYVGSKALGTLDGNGDVTGGDYFKTRTEQLPRTVAPALTFVTPQTPIGGHYDSGGSVYVYTQDGDGNTAPADYTYDVNTRTIAINDARGLGASNYFYTYTYVTGTPMVRVRKHLGTPTDPADPVLMAEVPSKWNSSCVLRGFCYTYIRIDLNQPDFQGGPPPVEVLLRGKKLYDFRTGVTAWSDNPALAIYDYLTSEICDVDVADIPLSQFIAAANICDEAQSFGKRYTLNGAVFSSDDKKATLEKMATAMGGEILDTTWDIFAGKYSAPVMTLYIDKPDGKGDVVGKMEITPGALEADTWNGVRGQYISSETQYIATDYTPYQNAAYVAADDDVELWQNLDFPFTDSVQRVHNLCRILTEDQRNAYTVKAEFSLKAWAVRYGQRVTVISTQFGWSKVMRVVSRRFSPNSAVELALKADDPTIWDSADAVTASATPATNLPDPFAIAKLASLTCTSGTNELLISQDGTIISRIRAAWPQATTQAVVTSGRIEIEWQRLGSSVWQKTETRGDDTEGFLSPVKDGDTYVVRARTVNTYLNVKSDWTYATAHQVVGKSEPPPNMENLSISGGVLNWTEVSRSAVRDYAGAVFRFHYGDNKDWGSAVDLHKGLITESPYDLLTRPSGVVTIMGKHRDTSGNDSTQAAVIVANLGDAVIANVVETVDFKADGFPGTLTACSIVSGDLIADDLDSAYGTDDQSFYGADNDPAYDISSYAQMVYMTNEVPINSALAGSVMTIEHVTQGIDLFIEYRLSGPGSVYGVDSDSAYGADSDSFYGEAGVWIPWPGQIIAANDVYQFRVTLGAGPSQGQITTLKLIVDAPDIVEYMEDVPISASGTAIPYTSNFSAIKTITATLQANASGAETIEIDKTVNLVPTAKAYNSSHTAVSGATADFIIKGR